MCGLHVFDKQNNKSTNATNFGVGKPQTESSTINTLVYLCVSMNFIYNWISTLSNSFAWRCRAYRDKMKESFEQIPTENPTPTLEDFKRKRQTLLTDIGGEW